MSSHFLVILVPPVDKCSNASILHVLLLQQAPGSGSGSASPTRPRGVGVTDDATEMETSFFPTPPTRRGRIVQWDAMPAGGRYAVENPRLGSLG